MKRISSNRKAVSNVLGYVFSFSIIALIMTSQMIFLATTQDKKSHEVAAFEAQNVANQVADALVRAVRVSQSMPDSHYYDVLDLPATLAGYDYGISIDENAVHVQTKDGGVSKSCLNYNAKNLAFDIRGEISSGEGEVVVTYTPPNFVYKLDFGKGDDPEYSVSHSPVKSGYYMVTKDMTVVTGGSTPDPSIRQPEWWEDNPGDNSFIGNEKCNFKHRIPLLIDNTGGEDLINVPVKIVLSSEDVDLDKIFYTFGTDYLNCDFYDHALSEVIEADLDDNGNSVIEAPPELEVGNMYGGCSWLAGQYMDTELEGFRDFIFDDKNSNDSYDGGELIGTGVPSGTITYYYYAKIGITIDGGIFIWDDVDGDGVYGEDEYVLDILDGASATGGNLALTTKGRIGVIGTEYYVYIDENLNRAYDAGRRLSACIDYDKTVVLTETIEGSGEEILTRKGNIVFLVNVNILADESKYIYLYYGSTRGSTQDSNYREYFDWDFDASRSLSE